LTQRRSIRPRPLHNLLAYERGYFSGGQLARLNAITLAAAAAVVVFVALPWWSLVGLPAVH